MVDILQVEDPTWQILMANSLRGEDEVSFVIYLFCMKIKIHGAYQSQAPTFRRSSQHILASTETVQISRTSVQKVIFHVDRWMEGPTQNCLQIQGTM
jgi:hypothetical protein